MKLSAIKIPHEKLHEALDLSDDVHISDMFLNNTDRYNRTFHVIVTGEHPVLQEHQEGSEVATNPLYNFQKIEPLYSPEYADGKIKRVLKGLKMFLGGE